jgi:hypothetical protein
MLRGGEPSVQDGKFAASIATYGSPLGLEQAQMEVTAAYSMARLAAAGVKSQANLNKERDQLMQERETAAENVARSRLAGKETMDDYESLVKGKAGAYSHALNMASVELGIIGVDTNDLPQQFTETPIIMDIVAEWVDSNQGTDRRNKKSGVIAAGKRLFTDPEQKRGLASFMLKRLSALGPEGQDKMARMAVQATREANPGMEQDSPEFLALARQQYRDWIKQAESDK